MMKKTTNRLSELLALLFALFSAQLLPTVSRAAPAEPEVVAAAESGLAALKQMASKETYSALGFHSLDEVSKAQIGTPLKMYLIGLDDLKVQASTADPKSVLRDLNERLVPIQVGGQVRASIIVSQDPADKKWKVASMGDAAATQLLDSARAKHEASKGKHDYFIVRVPALYEQYLAFLDGNGKMHYVTIHEGTETGGHHGEERDARTVHDSLTEMAKKAHPLARE